MGPAHMQMPAPTSSFGRANMSMPDPTSALSPHAGGQDDVVPFGMPEPNVPSIVPGKKVRKSKAKLGAAGGGGESTMSYNAGAGMPEPSVPTFGAAASAAGTPSRAGPYGMPEATVTDYTGGTGLTRTPMPVSSPALPPVPVSSFTPAPSGVGMPEPNIVNYTGGAGSVGAPLMPEPSVVDYTGAGKGKKQKGKKSGRNPSPVIPQSSYDDDEDGGGGGGGDEGGFIPPMDDYSAEEETKRGGGGGVFSGGWGGISKTAKSWGMPSVFGSNSGAPNDGGGGSYGSSPQPVIPSGSVFGGASTSPQPVIPGGMGMASPYGNPTAMPGGASPMMSGGYVNRADFNNGPSMPVPVIPHIVDDEQDDPNQDVDPQTEANTRMNASAAFLSGEAKKKKGKKSKRP
ncbi:hypothetical protein FA15DRAFT_672571 [Coprinopsis marcescibilis]|uniref:Uncharacterized protein n=1 Tax=Coprinopsis marcescibilis TaxID=230819 RepID=A0A5C3KMJ9_COPMA|nr:hypothetical protein FA15DRAFT_672571 [Coprinopsis marcescibilis]